MEGFGYVVEKAAETERPQESQDEIYAGEYCKYTNFLALQ